MSADAPIWKGDWKRRLAERIAALGFQSLDHFLESRPHRTYEELASELGGDVAAIQLSSSQFAQANLIGRLREAAQDSLTRELWARLRRGWPSSTDDWERRAAAFAAWVSHIEVAAQAPELRGRLDAVWHVLEAKARSGWLPKDPRDPLIDEAFQIGWPIDATA